MSVCIGTMLQHGTCRYILSTYRYELGIYHVSRASIHDFGMVHRTYRYTGSLVCTFVLCMYKYIPVYTSVYQYIPVHTKYHVLVHLVTIPDVVFDSS